MTKCVLGRLQGMIGPEDWDRFRHCDPGPTPCNLFPGPPAPSGPFCFPEPPEGITSGDPNGKFGPFGQTSRHHFRPGSGVSYLITFENEPTAAPAHEVFVQDVLDTLVFDPSTIKFDYMVVGDRIVLIDAPGKTFKTVIDLQPARYALVCCEGWLDESRGSLIVRFQTLDPGTGLPSEDPLGGFLPPNQTPPEGEAAVAFTVGTKATLPSGSSIQNSADIRFDSNAPITTPVWSNIVDIGPPESRVVPLPEVVADSVFTVSWAGTDDASGIERYDVFVSIDGGVAAPWRMNTAAETDLFVGSLGHRYAFYSVATDSTGNQESPPATADATTRVSGTTEVDASVVSAESDDTSVTVRWRLSRRFARVTIESNRNATGWAMREAVDRDPDGLVTYLDRSVASGDSIGYRLRADSLSAPFGEVWVKVQPRIEFGMRSLRGNPSPGLLALRIGLPHAGTGRLSVYDVAGRRIRYIPLIVPSPRLLNVDLGRLSSGVYFVRLELGKEHRTTKIVLLR